MKKILKIYYLEYITLWIIIMIIVVEIYMKNESFNNYLEG